MEEAQRILDQNWKVCVLLLLSVGGNGGERERERGEDIMSHVNIMSCVTHFRQCPVY